MAQKYFGSNIPVAAGFDLAAQRPLDAREVVAKYSDWQLSRTYRSMPD